MTTIAPSSEALNWNALSGPGQTSLGNPADLGPYRGMIQERGGRYDTEARDRLKWAKDQFEKNAATADKVQQQALDTGQTFLDWAKKDRGLYDEIYVPGMRQQMSDAMGWDSAGELAKASGEAIAGTNITFDAAADLAKRSLMGYGVDPSSGRFAGLEEGLATKRAANAAGVSNKAMNQRRLDKQALLSNAIRTGQVLPGQSVNEAGVSLAAGNQAVNTGLATAASGAQTLGTPMVWAGMGDDMMREWKNSLLEQTKLGMQQNRDAAEQRMAQAKLDQSSSSGIGAALGAGAGILGTVLGGPAGGMIGSQLGGMLGSAMAAKGGKIEKMRAGGMVRRPDIETDQIEDEDDAALVRQPYQPEDDPEPAIEWREPGDASDWAEETLEDARAKRYADGGAVDDENTDLMPPFDPEGSGYDYRTAKLAGIKRGRGGHMASRDPATGMMLKGRRHPSFGQAVEDDRKLGYGLEMRDGRYYTQPFSMAQRIWGTTTPEEADRSWADTPIIRPGPNDIVGLYQEGGEVNDLDEPELIDSPAEEIGEPSSMVPPEASPSGGEETDDVHALLNEGEFVIPKDVTSWFGEKFFQNLIQKAYKEKAQAQAQPEESEPQGMQAVALSAPPTFQTTGA